MKSHANLFRFVIAGLLSLAACDQKTAQPVTDFSVAIAQRQLETLLAELEALPAGAVANSGRKPRRVILAPPFFS